MIRRLLAVALMLVAGLAFLPQRSIALPPSPELSKWNEGTEPTQMVGETDAAFKIRRDAWIDAKKNRIRWNCYNYGVDVQTTGAGGKATRAHPGKGMAWPNEDSTLTAAQMCTKVLARAKADGLKDSGWKPGDPIPTPGVGQNLVALGGLAGLKSDGADYHWWRLNGDGTWSHKRGGTKAKTTYTDAGVEKPLTDPRIAGQRDGYDLCGFMFVPKAGITVGTLAAAPVCEPRDGTVLAQSVRGSGFPDPQKVLNSSEIYLLGSHLPSFSSPNEVPDPHWTEVPAGGPAGGILTTATHRLGSAPPPPAGGVRPRRTCAPTTAWSRSSCPGPTSAARCSSRTTMGSSCTWTRSSTASRRSPVIPRRAPCSSMPACAATRRTATRPPRR